MTRETAQKLLPVIQAFAEGKEIQFRRSDKSDGLHIPGPTWESDYDYRIKPREPVIATYSNRNGFNQVKFNPGALVDVEYTIIELTPEVTEAVKHLLPKQILTDETP